MHGVGQERERTERQRRDQLDDEETGIGDEGYPERPTPLVGAVLAARVVGVEMGVGWTQRDTVPEWKGGTPRISLGRNEASTR